MKGGARLLPALPLAFLVSACAGEPTRFDGAARSVAVDEAVAMPPPGDLAIVDIVGKRYDNALQQDIFLSTRSSVPGQNVMSVQFFGTKSPLAFSDDRLTFNPLTEARVNSEMRGTLPGIRMARSPLVVQNDYGAFGYAFGRPAPAELCMYGWQQIRSPAGTVSPLQNYGAIQIRVRICETGATEEKLLSFMYGFSITGSLDDPGWNPYGTPAPVSTRLGRSGAPVYPPATGETRLPQYGVSPLPSVAAEAARPVARAPSPAPARDNIETGAAPRPATPALPTPALSTPALAEQYPGIVVPSPSAGLPAARAVNTAAPRSTAPRRQAVVPVPGVAGAGAGSPVTQPAVPSPGCVPGSNGTVPDRCR